MQYKSFYLLGGRRIRQGNGIREVPEKEIFMYEKQNVIQMKPGRFSTESSVETSNG